MSASDPDYRAQPDAYRMGRSEQGVFHTPPYTEALLPLWRFKTPAMAQESADAISRAFAAYRADNDFVGMDVARKFLQMGYTRSRRYARHPGGRKFDAQRRLLAEVLDPEKQKSAEIFAQALGRVLKDAAYLAAKSDYQRRVGRTRPASRTAR